MYSPEEYRRIIESCPFKEFKIYNISENKHGVPYPMKGCFYFHGISSIGDRPYLWSLKKNPRNVDVWTSSTEVNGHEITEDEMKDYLDSLKDTVTYFGVGECRVKF